MRAIEMIAAALLLGAVGCGANVEDDASAAAKTSGGDAAPHGCDASRVFGGPDSWGGLDVGPQVVSSEPLTICMTLDLNTSFTTLVATADPVEAADVYDMTLWTADGELLQSGWNEPAWSGGPNGGILSWSREPAVRHVVLRITAPLPASTMVSIVFPLPT